MCHVLYLQSKFQKKNNNNTNNIIETGGGEGTLEVVGEPL